MSDPTRRFQYMGQAPLDTSIYGTPMQGAAPKAAQDQAAIDAYVAQTKHAAAPAGSPAQDQSAQAFYNAANTMQRPVDPQQLQALIDALLRK